MEARQALAALVAKTKDFVDAERKRRPKARVQLRDPLTASASAREAELVKLLSKPTPGAVRARSAPRTQPKLVFVGELSPAASELLAKVVVAMGLKKDEVQTLKLTSLSALQSEVEALNPKALVLLGEEAVRLCLGEDASVSKHRSKFQPLFSRPVMPTLHPADLLKNENLKRQLWEDMKLVVQKLKELA